MAPARTNDDESLSTGTPAGDPVERIACATGGGAALSDACTVDRTPDATGTLVTIRHPDGGFRRLRITPEGGIEAADGAMPAAVTTRDGVADVAIGDARYRLPLGHP